MSTTHPSPPPCGYKPVMNERPRPLPGDDEEIAPDVADADPTPLDPAEALRRERDKYGDDNTNPNRDDQLDEHHGEPSDIP